MLWLLWQDLQVPSCLFHVVFLLQHVRIVFFLPGMFINLTFWHGAVSVCVWVCVCVGVGVWFGGWVGGVVWCVCLCVSNCLLVNYKHSTIKISLSMSRFVFTFLIFDFLSDIKEFDRWLQLSGVDSLRSWPGSLRSCTCLSVDNRVI